ncbi:hypothetical protein CEUSTIGMA_g6958.t1 [Chlamydomonas eustigma]|uniref:Uncharacterized protein n=1 Tax=Chlamydomonas eustigma TaxID=1157962 RepID=A0A250X8Z1_9CHLO|nr:hypothetical protein CEUSTIGMA_g6958.t1 [Chlamydomonas eustigma]|eukprot:GAX79517.1 hypothetical protein CEUSTIGMA_g6958.t1 [Chlamydomonas eustigma]
MRVVDKKSIRLFCSGCHRGIHRHDSNVIECAGCHRWYHPASHQVLKSLVSRAASGNHELPAAIASTAAGSHSTAHSSSSSGNHMNKNSSGGRSWRLVFNQRPGLGGQVALGQM